MIVETPLRRRSQTAIANSRPVADFETTVNPTSPLKVYADPVGSTDSAPAGLYMYEWYWHDDNTYTYTYDNSSNGGIAGHTYAAPGTYNVTLTAYDSEY